MIYAILAGRCRNGAERDRGRLVHIVARPAGIYPLFGPALCGARPGRLSSGWDEVDATDAVCPRCAKKLEANAIGK